MQTPDRQQQESHPGLLVPADSPSTSEVQSWLQQGGRCVRFEFCLSFLVITVRRQSRPYLTGNWRERYLIGLGFSTLALVLGPWGIPWGVLGTARAIWTNLTGGVDATDELHNHFTPRTLAPLRSPG